MRTHSSWPLLLAALFFAGSSCALADGLSSLGFSTRYAAGPPAFLSSAIGRVPFRSRTAPALLNALLLGDRSMLVPELKEAFRLSGASHILALSGLHLGLVYAMLRGIGSLLGKGRAIRLLRSLATVSLCGLYTEVAGAPPSMVRAFLFIALAEGASLLGRKKDLKRSLCGALTLQLAASPSVILSTGFQLSYLAMTGIAVLYPVLDSWFPAGSGGPGNPVRRLWQMMAVSISCQLFTGPLAWLRFGTWPKYFLLSNLLALPLLSLLLPLSVLTVLLFNAGLCPGFLPGLVDGMCTLLYRLLELIAGL